MDSSVFLSSDLSDLSYFPYGEDGLTLVFCLRGWLRVHLDDTEYQIRSNDLLRYSDTAPLRDVSHSEDCEVRIYVIELHSLDSAFYHCLRSEGDWWGKWNFVMGHRVIHLDERQYELGLHFHQLIRLYTGDENYDYREQVLELIKQIFVYEVLMWINTNSAEETTSSPKHLLSQDAITRQFLHLVETRSQREREVRWYADQLYITPKYLGDVVKHVTGKTAIQLIREYAAREIENQLLHTDQPIKEIAFDMNFPSVSAFSKFVHHTLGAGPAEIRATKV